MIIRNSDLEYIRNSDSTDYSSITYADVVFRSSTTAAREVLLLPPLQSLICDVITPISLSLLSPTASRGHVWTYASIGLTYNIHFLCTVSDELHHPGIIFSQPPCFLCPIQDD